MLILSQYILYNSFQATTNLTIIVRNKPQQTLVSTINAKLILAIRLRVYIYNQSYLYIESNIERDYFIDLGLQQQTLLILSYSSLLLNLVIVVFPILDLTSIIAGIVLQYRIYRLLYSEAKIIKYSLKLLFILKSSKASLVILYLSLVDLDQLVYNYYTYSSIQYKLGSVVSSIEFNIVDIFFQYYLVFLETLTKFLLILLTRLVSSSFSRLSILFVQFVQPFSQSIIAIILIITIIIYRRYRLQYNQLRLDLLRL